MLSPPSCRSSFLSGYYKRRLRPPQAYTMGLTMVWARLAQHAPGLANFLTRGRGISPVVKRLGGYEHDHYDVSVRIAEGRLLPLLRDADPEALLIADGFSCKTQIEQLSERRPLHTAEVLRMAAGAAYLRRR